MGWTLRPWPGDACEFLENVAFHVRTLFTVALPGRALIEILDIIAPVMFCARKYVALHLHGALRKSHLAQRCLASGFSIQEMVQSTVRESSGETSRHRPSVDTGTRLISSLRLSKQREYHVHVRVTCYQADKCIGSERA